MKIINGVYSLPLELTYNDTTLSLNPVLVELRQGLMLIDAGTETTAEQLEAAIAATGHNIEEIRLLVFTHQDMDHAGGGDYVLERSGAVVCTSGAEAAPISGKTAVRGPESNSYTPIPVDIECPEGTCFQTAAGPLEVINTPGHTPGHISLFLRDSGTVIAGDALVIYRGNLAGPHPQMSEDVEMARRAVAHIAEYPVRGVLCFHGGYTQTSPSALRQLSEELRGLEK